MQALVNMRAVSCVAQQRCSPAMPHVKTVSPRRIAQAVHSSRRMPPLKAVQEGGDPEEQFEGLTPEEDFEIPGNYRDAMTSNTPLGKAVKEACAELDTLAALERETLSEADALLKKLGLKTSIFDVPAGSGGEGESSSEGQ